MEEERPSSKPATVITPPGEEPPQMETQMEQEETGTPGKPSLWIGAGFVVVILLVIIGLFLPPISLGQRLGLGSGSESAVTPETVTEDVLTVPDQVALAVSDRTTGVSVSSMPQAEFLSGNAAASLPGNLTVLGNAYVITYEGNAPTGSATLTIPAGAAALQTVDVYGWNGGWSFIPSRIDAANGQFTTLEGPLPQILALMQTAALDTINTGAELLPSQSLSEELLPLLSEVVLGTLTLGEGGQLQGEVAAAPAGAFTSFLRVSNVGAVVDQASLTALLSDPAAQSNQINALVQQVTSGAYMGINLDYQGVPENQAAAYTNFVTSLADALHAQGRKLVVTLATPQKVNSDWDSGGQDWAAIGRAADAVYIQMPLNPAVYGDNAAAEELINWAVGQISRYKITMLVSASAIDRIGDAFLELPNDQALANFGELQFTQGAAEVDPGTAVKVALSGTASPLEWDGASLTYRYTYQDNGQTHNVWLGNEAALSYRWRFAGRYHLRGVAVRGLGDVADGTGFAAALASLLGTAEAPQPAGAAIVWTVRGEDDSVLASSSGEALSFAWEGTEQPGSYSVNADFALGDNVARLGSLQVVVAVPSEPAAAAEEQPAPEAENTTQEDPPTETTDTAVANETGGGAVDPGDADAAVNVGANVRQGPGLSYGTIAGGLKAGDKITLIGRNSDASWLNIILPDGVTEGWIFASLVTVNPAVDVGALAVVQVEPPVVASGDDGSSGGGSPAPPPPAPPPISNSGFELGGQAFGSPYGMMSYAGMNWVKRQHKWGPGQAGNAVAGLIADAHNAGFKILLSIPGANLYPGSIDFAGYTNFLGQVAALPDPPDAIEVWNEMNIDREWPGGQINPASYVNNMLAPAYNAIKAANPSIMVISGAPAPTGFFGGCGGGGCDDAPYMAGMAGAGAANYMDCIGIHYNEGIISPNQTSGDPRSEHYTRYFWGMVDAYWNAFGGSRPLCFTELGYLTPEGYGSLPSGFAWAQNVTVSQQAQWLAEATSLSAGSGKVRLMIVWNVDSTTWDSDPQAGYAIIRPGGSCAACETLRQVMGR